MNFQMPILLFAQYDLTETSLGKKRQLEEPYPPHIGPTK